MPLSFTPRGLSLVFLGIFIVTLASAATPRKVLTKQGYVRGIRQTIQTYKGKTKTIYKFLGVPYAEKPIGDLRFKPPQPLTSQRQGIYKATQFRSICTQPDHYFESVKEAWPEFDPEKDVDEDCLYLNIYTPSTTSTKKYPVIFYIHGGSYVGGTPVREGSPGDFLPTRKVVLVTVQYRLGIFGFFSTGDSVAPGNLGLLDQVEALKWVRENIHAFGGDKNSVTLLGESAGGSSVSLHYLSPLTTGLFHRGIAVSGVDLSPFAITPKAKVLDASKRLTKNLNCTGESSEILHCAQSFPRKTVTENVPFHDLFHLQPYIDNHFLNDDPMKLQKEGKFQKLPLMSGFVSQECSFLLEAQQMKEYNTSGFRKYLDGFLQFEFERTKTEAPVAYNALEFQYTPWGDQNNCSAFRQKLIEMLTDRVMIGPTHAALVIRSDHGALTYMFEFTHRSQYHPKPKWMGVVHEDTTAYKFGLPLFNTDLTKLRFDDDDKKVSDMTVTMFLNFAKFGNPTPSPVYGTRWDNFTSSNKAYLKIQKNPAMTSKYHPLRMAFWNTYFPTLLPAKSTPSSEESVSSDEAMKRGRGKWKPVFW